jgi:hypothetical protein
MSLQARFGDYFSFREFVMTITEAVMGTFVSTAIAIGDHVDQKELNAGVYILGVKLFIDIGASGAAANSTGNCCVDITKKVKTDTCHITDTDLVFQKVIYHHYGANAACINYISKWKLCTTEDAEGFTLLHKSRNVKVDPQSPNTAFYTGIKSGSQAAASAARLLVKLAIAKQGPLA